MEFIFQMSNLALPDAIPKNVFYTNLLQPVDRKIVDEYIGRIVEKKRDYYRLVMTRYHLHLDHFQAIRGVQGKFLKLRKEVCGICKMPSTIQFALPATIQPQTWFACSRRFIGRWHMCPTGIWWPPKKKLYVLCPLRQYNLWTNSTFSSLAKHIHSVFVDFFVDGTGEQSASLHRTQCRIFNWNKYLALQKLFGSIVAAIWCRIYSAYAWLKSICIFRSIRETHSASRLAFVLLLMIFSEPEKRFNSFNQKKKE